MSHSSALTRSVHELTAEITATLRLLLPAPAEVALLDFPAHTNAGDSLIYLGQQRLLRDLGHRIGYLADTRVYSPEVLRRRVPHGPILLQGGGNLGDRWRHTQEFRERVIQDFPDRPIVQLPQSIDFRDEARQRRAGEVFAAHPDLLLLFRDHRSLARARAAFPGVRIEFCPDLAAGFGPRQRIGRPDVDVLMLMREDSESRDGDAVRLPPRVTRHRTDWGFPGAARLTWHRAMLPSGVARHLPALRPAMQPAVESSFDAMATLNVRRAMSILSRGRVVVTDRLHAAVLAALMGIRVTVMDNANGKISAAYEAYLHRLPTLTYAASPAEAQRIVLDQLTTGA